jgi:ABC-type methionine transport system ATPase subunit
MRKIVIVMSFVYILSMGPAYGGEEIQNNGDVIIPPGMEVIKKGDVNVVVPKGGQLRKQGSVMLIETADEYAARKFMDTDDHFEKIEGELENTEKEIKGLKSAVKKSEEGKRKKMTDVLQIPVLKKEERPLSLPAEEDS